MPGNQKKSPLVTNQRGEREWLWLLSQVDPATLQEAFEQLGNRKPFPLNIAKILSLELPEEAALPLLESQRTERLAALAELRKKLRAV